MTLEELQSKVRVAEIRLRLIRSALKSDQKDLKERGRIKGFGRKSDEWNRVWIEKAKQREKECMELIEKLKSQIKSAA